MKRLQTSLAGNPRRPAQPGSLPRQRPVNEPRAPLALTIRHQLPHRLRFACSQPLTPGQLELLTALMGTLHPDLVIRPAAHRRGVVILRPGAALLCPALVANQLEAVLQAVNLHGPVRPPTAFERWLGDTRRGSIKLLMALAIAGWALPILPGTPFFLLAWWLGWRPEKTSGSAETQLEPAVLDPGP